MSFRITVISPLKAADADINRRQERYAEVAQPQTTVEVINLQEGPSSLNTSGDLLLSAAAILREFDGLEAHKMDAVLVDCVFDPAVNEIREAAKVPTFGPTKATLPLIGFVARNFSIIARTKRQCELLAETVTGYGYGEKICSLRALDINYEEARQPEIFNQVMEARLKYVVTEDGAEAIMFGSTTMAITDDMRQVSRGIPLFMPGMVALQVIEQLWYGELWPRSF